MSKFGDWELLCGFLDVDSRCLLDMGNAYYCDKLQLPLNCD